MQFYRKCWFNLFNEQFIFLLNFGQNYFVQLGWNWFFVPLPVTNAWNCHLLYTAFSSNVGAWGMWACALFLSCNMDFNDAYVILHRVSFNQHLVLVLTVNLFSFMIALFWISSLINYFFYTIVFFKICPSIWHNMKKKLQSFERLACIQKHSQWHLYLSSQIPITKCWFTVFAKFLEIDLLFTLKHLTFLLGRSLLLDLPVNSLKKNCLFSWFAHLRYYFLKGDHLKYKYLGLLSK